MSFKNEQRNFIKKLFKVDASETEAMGEYNATNERMAARKAAAKIAMDRAEALRKEYGTRTLPAVMPTSAQKLAMGALGKLSEADTAFAAALTEAGKAEAALGGNESPKVRYVNAKKPCEAARQEFKKAEQAANASIEKYTSLFAEITSALAKEEKQSGAKNTATAVKVDAARRLAALRKDAERAKFLPREVMGKAMEDIANADKLYASGAGGEFTEATRLYQAAILGFVNAMEEADARKDIWTSMAPTLDEIRSHLPEIKAAKAEGVLTPAALVAVGRPMPFNPADLETVMGAWEVRLEKSTREQLTATKKEAEAILAKLPDVVLGIAEIRTIHADIKAIRAHVDLQIATLTKLATDQWKLSKDHLAPLKDLLDGVKAAAATLDTKVTTPAGVAEIRGARAEFDAVFDLVKENITLIAKDVYGLKGELETNTEAFGNIAAKLPTLRQSMPELRDAGWPGARGLEKRLEKLEKELRNPGDPPTLAKAVESLAAEVDAAVKAVRRSSQEAINQANAAIKAIQAKYKEVYDVAHASIFSRGPSANKALERIKAEIDATVAGFDGTAPMAGGVIGTLDALTGELEVLKLAASSTDYKDIQTLKGEIEDLLDAAPLDTLLEPTATELLTTFKTSVWPSAIASTPDKAKAALTAFRDSQVRPASDKAAAVLAAQTEAKALVKQVEAKAKEVKASIAISTNGGIAELKADFLDRLETLQALVKQKTYGPNDAEELKAKILGLKSALSTVCQGKPDPASLDASTVQFDLAVVGSEHGKIATAEAERHRKVAEFRVECAAFEKRLSALEALLAEKGNEEDGKPLRRSYEQMCKLVNDSLQYEPGLAQLAVLKRRVEELTAKPWAARAGAMQMIGDLATRWTEATKSVTTEVEALEGEIVAAIDAAGPDAGGQEARQVITGKLKSLRERLGRLDILSCSAPLRSEVSTTKERKRNKEEGLIVVRACRDLLNDPTAKMLATNPFTKKDPFAAVRRILGDIEYTFLTYPA